MDLALSPAHDRFREEVRAFLAARLTPEIKAEAARSASVFADGPLARRWHRILFEQGWIAPAWPKEYGGCGWGVVERYIFDSECAAAGAPSVPVMGLQMCGPVLMRFGTEAQKDYFLPRILSGEHYWCQGYSEPGSGSDLASLQMKAVRDGDCYVLDGTKIWTTHAQFANWMFVLARTSSAGKPQEGISFFLVPMDAPGLKIAPIITLAGDHEVNQVFFDGVRTPADHLVGQENQGWTIAKYLLEFERGGAYAARLRAQLAHVRRIAQEERADGGGALIEDEAFRQRLAEMEMEVDGVEAAERIAISKLSVGGAPGPAVSSMLKLAGTETSQRVSAFALEAVAHYGAPDTLAARQSAVNDAPTPDHALTAAAHYFNLRASTIYGGSSEVQRNVLAKAALAL